MMPGKSSTSGYHVATMIHDCFKPDIDVYVYRDASPEAEEIYIGKAANVPANLMNLRVIDMWWDDYYLQFNVEVR